jgi:hypothetical protein
VILLLGAGFSDLIVCFSESYFSIVQLLKFCLWYELNGRFSNDL